VTAFWVHPPPSTTLILIHATPFAAAAAGPPTTPIATVITVLHIRSFAADVIDRENFALILLVLIMVLIRLS